MMTRKVMVPLFCAVLWIATVAAVENSVQPAVHKICATCSCETTTKTINCVTMNLFHVFTIDEWKTLNTNETGVDIVRFDNNGIAAVTAFPSLPIRYLSFRHNLISRIEQQSFKNLTRLEHLDLSYNRLTSEVLMPEVFKGKYSPDTYEPLKFLKTLNLGNNRLHTLNPDLFEHFPNLENLSLESNPFMVLDHLTTQAISGVSSLKFLDLSYMELTVLPEHIFHAPRKLESLNLTGNLFKILPQALQYAVNLVELNLDENLMEDFSRNNVFPALPKLTSLSISYMETLKTINYGALSNLPALQKLLCTNNPHLSSFHEHAFSHSLNDNKTRQEWPPIRTLLLHSNNLSALPFQLLGRWDEIETIDLRLNPWRCDCDNQWMVDKLIPLIRNTTPALLTQIVCDHPDQMVGVELHEVFDKHHHMRCSDRFGSHPEHDGAILIGILVGLLIGIPLSMGIILIYRRGCFGFLGYGPGPADYTRAFYKRAGVQEELNI